MNFAFPPEWLELVTELERQPDDQVVAKQSFDDSARAGSTDDVLRLLNERGA